MSNFITTLLRGCLGFGLLLIFTRIIGNKQLGQLNIFTYISGIAVGAMAGGMVIYHNIEVFESVVGIMLWGTLTILLEKTTLHSRKARGVLAGHPMMIIKKGIIQHRILKKERMNLDDLTMLLRTNDVFSVREVEYAILEASGELSVLRKASADMPTRADLQLPAPPERNLPAMVVCDGRLLRDALVQLGKDEAWLHTQLAEQGVALPEVFYAELSADGSLYCQRR